MAEQNLSHTEQPTYPPYPAYPAYPVGESGLGWREVATGISGGSWAIVLVLGVLFFYIREPFKEWMSKQLALLDELRENLRQNSDTLKTMADTDLKTASILDAMERRHGQVDSFMESTSKSLTRIEEKLDRPTQSPQTDR